jgi:succinoglycan biosynthesis transport protein ExoP
MTVREFFGILRRRVLVLVVSVVVCVALAGVYVGVATKSYTADAQVFVASVTTSSDLDQSFNGSQFIDNRVASYAQLATSDQVTQAVISSLQLNLTPTKLADKITASVPLDTVVIDIAVSDESATESARIANAVAEQLVTTVQSLEAIGDDASPVKLSVVQHATKPSSPSSPQLVLDLVLGLIIGLALGVAIALLSSSGDAGGGHRGGSRRRSAGSPLAGTAPDDASGLSDTPSAVR